MSAFKFSLLWLLFAATYVCFFIPIFLYFPEIWLHNLLTNHGQNFMDEGEWDKIFMLSVMWLTVVVNLIFIFFSSTITQKLHKSATNGFQHSASVRMRAFKFSSLWLLFIAIYFGFVGLIFLFFPGSWLCYILIDNYDQLVKERAWNAIFVPATLFSALIINLVFIFFSLTIIQRLRNRKETTA